jgi:DNA-binding NarL/FixJ family response regulator
VLVAAGQALVRAGLRSLLEGEGITVAGEAASGDEVVAAARRLRPDVVLIDASLPGLDAVEATRQTLAGPGAAEVLLLTASDGDDSALAGLRAGAIGLLLKDAQPAELARAVRALARGEALLSPRVTRRLIAELAAQPEPPRRLRPGRFEELTDRELEVVALVARGLTNDEIAERLMVSPATSKTHVSRAMVKLGAHDRAQLVVFAYESALVLQAIS